MSETMVRTPGRRTARRPSLSMLGLGLCLACCTWASPVHAQSPAILLPERFEVRVGGESFLGLIVPDFHRGPVAVSPRTTVTGLRLLGDVSRNSFTALLADGTEQDAVAYRYRTEVVADIRLPSGLIVGAGLPFVQQRGRVEPDVPRLTGDALGDGWLEGVYGWRVSGEGHIGLAGRVNVPIGNEDLTLGIGTPAVLAELVSGWQVHERVLIAANLGVRTVRIFGRSPGAAGDEFVYRLGSTFTVAPPLRADVVLDGAVAIDGDRIDSRVHPSVIAPLEARVGIRWNMFSSALAVHAGAGFGMTRGQGTPLSRFLLGIELACALGDCPVSGGADRDGDGIPDREDRCPDRAGEGGCPPTDGDGDGIPDSHDRCPAEAEDEDGFADDDGCPDLDNDRDGVLDSAEPEACRLMPEDIDGVEDEDGCPDLDDDADGIPDVQDRCPRAGAPALRALVARLSGPLQRSGDPRSSSILVRLADPREDFDGFEDDDGCPDLDHDRDGLVDAIDSCPRLPGTIEGQGCPPKGLDDRDGDGIGDDLDRCPDAPEERQGLVDTDGCPEPWASGAITAGLALDDAGRVSPNRPLTEPDGREGVAKSISALLRARDDLRLVVSFPQDAQATSDGARSLVDALRNGPSADRLTIRCGVAQTEGPFSMRLCTATPGSALPPESGWPARMKTCTEIMEGGPCATL